MKNVSYIELVFENCEEVKIEQKYIGYFHMSDINCEITRIAINAISRCTVADEFAIEIFSEADGPFVSFGHDTGKTIFGRIMAWRDITHINVVYDDGTEEYIGVNYDEGLNEGKLGAENILQSSKMSRDGNLYLLISTDGEDIDKLFPDDEINNTSEIRSKKLLYGVVEEKDNE